MKVRERLAEALQSPSADHLWLLRGDLLEAGVNHDAPVLRVVSEFSRFLDELAGSTNSKEYSELASLLDIGAVGGVVLERLTDPKDAEELALRLFSGLVSEGLMVLATRQHVKSWECELDNVYRAAAWYLFDELWRWSLALKPDLDRTERRGLIDRLLAPARSPESDGLHKAALLGHLFQLLLLSYLSREALE